MRNSFARRAIVVVLTAFTLFAIVPRPLRAADIETVRVGRAVGDSWLFATLEVGQDAHIWEKVGLKVDIASFKGDGQLQQALTSGAVDFGLGSGPAMGYRAKGVPAIGVAVMTQAPIDLGIVIGANSSIKTIADLKGKKIGVSTAGSLTDWLVHELSRRQGWGADGIESVPMGTNEVRSDRHGSNSRQRDRRRLCVCDGRARQRQAVYHIRHLRQAIRSARDLRNR